MATDKLFTVAGTSALNGVTKVRFANDQMRVKVLAKSGHTDINLVELPEAMTKLDAVKFIKNLDEFTNVVEQVAIADYLDRKDEAPAKVVAKAKTPVKTKTKAAPKAKVDTSAMEDAPF
jgi:hypothetical protein